MYTNIKRLFNSHFYLSLIPIPILIDALSAASFPYAFVIVSSTSKGGHKKDCRSAAPSGLFRWRFVPVILQIISTTTTTTTASILFLFLLKIQQKKMSARVYFYVVVENCWWILEILFDIFETVGQSVGRCVPAATATATLVYYLNFIIMHWASAAARKKTRMRCSIRNFYFPSIFTYCEEVEESAFRVTMITSLFTIERRRRRRRRWIWSLSSFWIWAGTYEGSSFSLRGGDSGGDG